MDRETLSSRDLGRTVSGEVSTQRAFPANWVTKQCRLISLPNRKNNWRERGWNPGRPGPDSSAQLLRQIGSETENEGHSYKDKMGDITVP